MTMETTYGEGCKIVESINIKYGYFDISVLPMSRGRPHNVAIKFTDPNYLKVSQIILVDSFVRSKSLYIGLNTVKLTDRDLGGVYRFSVVDAKTMLPLGGFSGTHQISATSIGDWKSNDLGEVHLENLRVGLTNVKAAEDPKYFG